MINIEISNPKEVKEYINGVSKSATNSMGKALARASLFVQGEVKLSIAGKKAELKSVDTGRFLNSVGIRLFNNDNAQVYSDLSYANFLEYGTSKFKARRHFNNTKDRSKTKIKQIFDEELKKAIKSV